MKLEEFRRILLNVDSHKQGMVPPVQKKTFPSVQTKKKVVKQEVTREKGAASGVRRQESPLATNKAQNPVSTKNPNGSDSEQEEAVTFFRRIFNLFSRTFNWCLWIVLVPFQLTRFVCQKTYTIVFETFISTFLGLIVSIYFASFFDMTYPLFAICRLILGTLYPAYASYKAVRTKNVREYVKWMMYWIVFAIFTSIETFADVFIGLWLPFYYELKILILLWLISPVSSGSLGSSILYRKFVHPTLMKREEEIDHMLSRFQEQGYNTLSRLIGRAFRYVTDIVMQTAIRGGGGLVYQLRKSYSLTDLGDENASYDSREALGRGKSRQVSRITDITDEPDEYETTPMQANVRRRPRPSNYDSPDNSTGYFFNESDYADSQVQRQRTSSYREMPSPTMVHSLEITPRGRQSSQSSSSNRQLMRPRSMVMDNFDNVSGMQFHPEDGKSSMKKYRSVTVLREQPSPRKLDMAEYANRSSSRHLHTSKPSSSNLSAQKVRERPQLRQTYPNSIRGPKSLTKTCVKSPDFKYRGEFEDYEENLDTFSWTDSD